MEGVELKTQAARMPPDMEQQFQDPAWGAQKLAEITVFRSFTDEELRVLYKCGQIVSYSPKAYAVIEGEPTRGLYIILHGTVSVYKNDPVSGSMARLAYLEAGNNFGEFSLFDDAPRSASVAAESTCHMFYLDAENFHRVLKEQESDMQLRFYKSCAEELVTRFRRLNADYIGAQQLLWKHALRQSDETDGGDEQT